MIAGLWDITPWHPRLQRENSILASIYVVVSYFKIGVPSTAGNVPYSG